LDDKGKGYFVSVVALLKLGDLLLRRFAILIVTSVAIVGVTTAGWAAYVDQTATRAVRESLQSVLAQARQATLEAPLTQEFSVPRGYAFADVLQNSGIDSGSTYSVVQAAQSVFDLRRVRAGNRLSIGQSVVGDLQSVRYQIDPENSLWVTPASEPARFIAEIRKEPATITNVTAVGRVSSSLWEAILESGEGPELVMQIADIFGWDIDFNTEPRAGDTFRVAFEKKTYADGTTSYARVFAAEYVNQGHAYQAVLFRDPNGRPAYYAPDGSSLQKMFLRSPLVFGGRVSSRFSNARFHPILKRVRPHLGIDYAAPTGSPVQSIGNGRVVFAGRKGGEGNMVQVRHSNGYDTMYLHLSRILVRSGQRVDQGQRIGLVGSTGLATAPHLDFRITQNGRYRNFEALRLPPATPVAKRDWNEFAAARDAYLALLPPAAEPGVQKATATRAGASGGSSTQGQ